MCKGTAVRTVLRGMTGVPRTWAQLPPVDMPQKRSFLGHRPVRHRGSWSLVRTQPPRTCHPIRSHREQPGTGPHPTRRHHHAHNLNQRTSQSTSPSLDRANRNRPLGLDQAAQNRPRDLLRSRIPWWRPLAWQHLGLVPTPRHHPRPRHLRFTPDGGHRDSGTDGSAGRMSACPANAGRSRPNTRSRPPVG